MRPPKDQLEMVRGPEPIPFELRVPDAYLLRQIEPRDRESYGRLFTARFPDAELPLDDLIDKSLPGGFLVVEHLASSKVVASAAAALYPRDRHPDGASLQWVIGDEAHSGRGLGMAVCSAATAGLAEAGYSLSFLRTDDARLPAISIYLRLGWTPLLYADDMEDRWRSVFTKLGRTFDPGQAQSN